MMTPGATPRGNLGMMTPSATPNAMMTPDAINAMRIQQDLDERNRPWTDAEIDEMLPAAGYKILEPPANYKAPARARIMATPTPLGEAAYQIPSEQKIDMPKVSEDLPFQKPEDYEYFKKLLDEQDEEKLPLEEQKERRIMRLLLKVKNGTPPQRKTALRQLTEKARWFGPSAPCRKE